MARITVPLNLLKSNPAESLRELRSREGARQKAGSGLREAENFKLGLDIWMDLVASLDDVAGVDYAAHKKGRIVLENVNDSRNRNGISSYQEFSAEQTLSESGKASSSKIEIRCGRGREKSSSLITYKSSPGKEIYTETFAGKSTRLVIDHKRGTLTYSDPHLHAFE
jgi:hypothetical protein